MPEYKILEVGENELEKTLNEYGTDGWTLETVLTKGLRQIPHAEDPHSKYDGWEKALHLISDGISYAGGVNPHPHGYEGYLKISLVRPSNSAGRSRVGEHQTHDEAGEKDGNLPCLPGAHRLDCPFRF